MAKKLRSDSSRSEWSQRVQKALLAPGAWEQAVLKKQQAERDQLAGILSTTSTPPK